MNKIETEKHMLLPLCAKASEAKSQSMLKRMLALALAFLTMFILYREKVINIPSFLPDHNISDKGADASSHWSMMQKHIKMERVVGHLKVLSDIAKLRSNSRSILNGYNASAAYISKVLKDHTDYDVELQPFEVELFSDSAPPVLQVNGKNYQVSTVQHSGSGSVINGQIVLVKNGCEVADFQSVKENQVLMLFKEGPCDYKNMLQIAAESKAAALMLYTNLPSSEPVSASLRRPVSKPVIGLSHYAAIEILELMVLNHDMVHGNITTSTLFTKAQTVNIIATTKGGNESSVILAGSHLDSVAQGPGINDDGSGASGTLEVAVAFYKSGLASKSQQKVKFAFWSGEELGLLGSTYYVKDLVSNNPTALAKIKLSLDNDMIASPNYIRGVYNGYEAENPSMRLPCGVIQELFERWFSSQGLATVTVPFDGRSDYGPFLEQEIPSGGLFTGAEHVKSKKEAKLFGGYIGVPYDPCYHRACDTLSNINLKIMKENVEAIGVLVHRLSWEKDLDGLLAGEKALDF